MCFHSSACRSLFIQQRVVHLSNQGVSAFCNTTCTIPVWRSSKDGSSPVLTCHLFFSPPLLSKESHHCSAFPATSPSCLSWKFPVRLSTSFVHMLPVFDLIHRPKNISRHIIAGSVCACVPHSLTSIWVRPRAYWVLTTESH